jgi:uncharacterized protein YdhG (YjbR/CyaY superfamily)
MRGKATSFDDYLEGVSAEHRAALERLRRTIRAAAPKVEETLSYGIPTFKLDGRGLVAFGAAAKHCALYPMSGRIIGQLEKELRGFDTSKGTIRFQPERPLPVTVVKKVLKLRIAENERAARKRRR